MPEIDDGIASITAALGDSGAAMSPFFRIPGLARNDQIEEYTRSKGLQVWSADFPADDWDVINHSANGFRLARSEAGQKVLHDQLMALCPPDGENFILAHSCWLMQEERGGVVAGIAVLPGLPTGVALRPEASQATGEPFVRGFLLPPVAAIGEPASLVIPSGMYSASRILEVEDEHGHWRAVMKKLKQRGSDFERVTFEVI